MFWFFYIIAAIFFSLLIGSFFQNRRGLIILITFVVFVTPSEINPGMKDFSPSLFSFLFNLILENNYSIRVLRPLVLSVPFTILLYSVSAFIKKRLF